MWEPLTPDDYGAFEQAAGLPVTRRDGAWWLKIRPFFYRPLLALAPLPADGGRKGLGPFASFQHAVEEGRPFNSHLNRVVFERVHDYRRQHLPRSARRKLEAARRYGLEARPLHDTARFIAEAYPVYTSFHERTGYGYPRARTRRAAFAAWARTLFCCPQALVLGIYCRDRLLSVEVSCLVGHVLILKESLNSREALAKHASDFALDWQRTQAARRPDIHIIDAGYLGRKEGINRFKLERGARVLALPAHLHIPPLLLQAFRYGYPPAYERLRGWDAQQARDRMSSVTRSS